MNAKPCASCGAVHTSRWWCDESPRLAPPAHDAEGKVPVDRGQRRPTNLTQDIPMEYFYLVIWLNSSHPPLHLGRYILTRCEAVGTKWVDRTNPPGPKGKAAVVFTAGYACLPVQ